MSFRNMADAIDEPTPKWMAKFEKNMLAKMELSITKAMDVVTSRLDKVEHTTRRHTAMFDHIKKEQHKLADRINQIETRSMRENLLFSGIPESEDETNDDLRDKINQIIEDDLQIDQWDIHYWLW